MICKHCGKNLDNLWDHSVRHHDDGTHSHVVQDVCIRELQERLAEAEKLLNADESELVQLMIVNEKHIEEVEQRLAAAEAREQKDIAELQRRSRECVSLLEKLAAAEATPWRVVVPTPTADEPTRMLEMKVIAIDHKEHVITVSAYVHQAAKGGRYE